MKWLINKIKNLFKKEGESSPVIIPEVVVDIKPNELGIVIKESMMPELKTALSRINAMRERYEVVAQATGVPWYVIPALHYRESSLSFACVLHNGEKILGTGRKTTLVPKGRGPFITWEEAAIDALLIEKDKFPAEWDLAGCLDFCEKYNGLGYRKRGIPSPYVYAGTNKYSKGLYVADGKFDANKQDKRLGTAPIILGLLA